ncbi:DUF4288 domain-containing protein [Allokutzneria oryzae]|uniref:DUF4288 domain-containing protein n=1 Tax=Allokutzneria oryzae TaxID=1378989 RepID=A0ABV5ZQK5_9PSEU
MPWFSASARYAVIVECDGLDLIARSVWVFSQPDTGERMWADAHEKALRIAREQEDVYRNVNGRRVHWKLVDVQTLDLLGETVTDGREVYSELGDPTTAQLREWDSRTAFDPDGTVPHQTGV